MYVHHVVGAGSYTTSTTNMYHKDRFHVHRGGGDFWSIPAVPGVCRCRCFTVSLLMQQHLRIMFGKNKQYQKNTWNPFNQTVWQRGPTVIGSKRDNSEQ